MNIVQLKMTRVLLLSIACIVVGVPLLWYCCGDQIAFVYQLVYFGETSDMRFVYCAQFSIFFEFRTCIQGAPSARGLGWAEFDLGVPPSCPAAKFPLFQAELGRHWNTQNPLQPNPGPRAYGTACILPSKILKHVFQRTRN